MQDYLNVFCGELAATIPSGAVRWIAADKIHLTLRFLGDTDKDVLPDISRQLDQLTATQEPFALQLGKLGCFPNRRQPRVLWAGVRGHLERLEEFHAALEKRLVPLGWEPERRSFNPHLTLGRAKDSRRLSAARPQWGRALDPLPIPVHQIHLIESHLYPQGAVYTPRHVSLLAKHTREDRRPNS